MLLQFAQELFDIFVGFFFVISKMMKTTCSLLIKVIEYCTLPVGNPVSEGKRALIRNMWNERIKGTKRNVEVKFLSVSFLCR